MEVGTRSDIYGTEVNTSEGLRQKVGRDELLSPNELMPEGQNDFRF